MQKNKITIISRNQFQQADVEKQNKIFSFQNNHIHYENQLEIKENKHPKIDGINVINNLCQIQRKKLIKSTYIYFQDRLIKIEDSFYLQNSPKNVKVDTQIIQVKNPINYNLHQIESSKNISLYNKQSATIKKKDLKNIVKNIVKIFIHWLQKYHKNQKCKFIMCQLLQSHKFNNTLVREMAQIKQINQAFVYFLKNSGEDLIQQSRIHDKKTHLQVLKKYTSIFIPQKRNFGQSTSGNGSNYGNSSQQNRCNSRDQKSKSPLLQGSEQNGYLVLEKTFNYLNEQPIQNNSRSKGSDSDKVYNSNSDNYRNGGSMMGSVDQYPRERLRGSNTESLIFFSSSGSDQ